MFRIPKPLAQKFCEGLSKARILNYFDCDQSASEKAEGIDALERLFADGYVEVDAQYAACMRLQSEKGDYAQSCMVSLERDKYRCVLCRKSGLNTGGVRTHHIIPRGAGGPLCDPDNQATVCERHHSLIHHDWRAWCSKLFALTGVSPEKAAHLLAEAR